MAVHEIEKFAYELGAPIISEDPLRFKNAVAHVPFLFSDARVRRVLRPELAVVVGRTTLSLSTNTYIQLAEKTLVVDSRAKKIDTARSAHEIYDTIPTVNSKINSDQNWIQAFKVFESLARKTLSTYPEWSEGGVASLLAAELEKDSALFISSSRPIRDLEAFASPRAGVITYSNRGLS